MKQRRILSGIASLLLVAMFYTFAFCIVQDVYEENFSADIYAEEEVREAPETADTEIENAAPEETGDTPELPSEDSVTEEQEQLPLFCVDLPDGMTLPRAVPLSANSRSNRTNEADSGDYDEVTDSDYNENSDFNAEAYSPEELDELFPEEDDIEEYSEYSARGENAKSSSKEDSSSKKKKRRKKKKTEETKETEVKPADMPQSDGNWDGTVSIDNSGDGKPVNSSADTEETFTVKVRGEECEYNAFDLVCMIVANEMSPSFGKEALKAQAVAAYSYVKYHEYHGLTASVLVKEDIPDEVRLAVSEVFGQCCYYNGAPAQTVYTASTSGFTASASNVWGGDEVPYLINQTCAFDVNYDPNYGVSTTYTTDEMRSKLENFLGEKLSDKPERWLVITEYEDGNYVKSITVDGKYSINGRQMREGVMGYGIKSTSFEISYSDDTFTITTYGYGHGVGMSQNGANILARQGYTYDQILKFYYPGVTIQ